MVTSRDTGLSLVVVFGILIGASVLSAFIYWIVNRLLEPEPIVWTMVHVSGSRLSGDAHLLQFPDGRNLLIDTGYSKYASRDLIPVLDMLEVSRLDMLIITHAHKNHYGGIRRITDHIQSVDTLIFNKPDRNRCMNEDWSGGCDYIHILDTLRYAKDRGISIRETEAGGTLWSGQDYSLEVLYAHDGVSDPIGKTDINDTSLVMKLTYGDMSVLFPGDLNRKGGKYLLENDPGIKSKLLAAPHHGVEFAASNRFLERVNAETVLVSVSEKAWSGDRAKRMREFFDKSAKATYVSGIDGSMQVRIRPDRYFVDRLPIPE